MICFVFLGIITGILATLFIKINYKIVIWRRKILTGPYPHWIKILLGPVPYTAIIALVTCIFTLPTFLGKFFSLGVYDAMQDLVNESNHHDNNPNTPFKAKDWDNGDLLVNLAVYCVAR
jgi:H+/Cl- antiporter ClcA